MEARLVLQAEAERAKANAKAAAAALKAADEGRVFG